MLQEVAGEALWKHMYCGTNVATDMLVPFQMGGILQDSLLKAEEVMKTYNKLIDYGQQSSKKFKELHEEDAKERKDRAGKYSPY